MAKKRDRLRRQQARSPTVPPTLPEAPISAPSRRAGLPDWRWRTFPVFVALVAGVLLGSFVTGRPTSDLAVVVRIAALLGAGYAVAHLFVTNVIVGGRIRRREAAARNAPREDEEWVEEVVHPEES